MSSQAFALNPQEIQTARQVAVELAQNRNLRAAEIISRLVAGACPDHFPSLLISAHLCEACGDTARAIAVYEKAIEVNPGHALPFTRRALILVRQQLGNPRPARSPAANRPVVAMSTLGTNGRFGNQILQYAALRRYADVVGAVACAPDWIGRDLFGLDDPMPPAAELATIPEPQATAIILGKSEERSANVDLHGYFGQCAPRSESRSRIRSYFQPVPRLKAMIDDCMNVLAARGKTVVALHLRRGDFDGVQFWIAPCVWYREWLETVWPTLDNPVLYIATDEPATIPEFAKFQPVTAADMPHQLRGAEFFFDHSILRHADVVACSPSTFSSTACLLNDKAKRFMMPDRDRKVLVEWSPWLA